MANHPDKFDVVLIETASYTGGQATSIPLDESKYGASWLNDGVQGGSSIFQHTFRFFRLYGHEPHPVKLQVSFGKGRDSFYTNVFPSPLVDQFSGEIKKFGRALKCIKCLLPILGILPLKIVLRLFRFNDDFTNRMLIPLVALFLGTGNQTPNVPSALLERLLDDKNMRLWDYDDDALLANLPTMYTFPNLGDFYRDWTADLRSKGVTVRLDTTATVLERGKNGIILQSQVNDGDSGPVIEEFDDMVLCCLADDAKKVLGQHATRREKYVLGGVKFFEDITITHTDSNYFQQVFETRYTPDLCGESSTKQRKEQIAFAAQHPRSQKDGWIGFRPMYFTHSAPPGSDKIEMGFDCTHYQHQFREQLGMNQPSPPPERHVYQTIFLNHQENDLWTWDAIDESKIICRKWWHQMGHRWQHYVRVLPGMMFINGINRTLYAGAWTMVVS